MEQRRGEYRMDGVDRALSYTVLTDVLRQWLVIFCFAVSAALLAAALRRPFLLAIYFRQGKPAARMSTGNARRSATE